MDDSELRQLTRDWPGVSAEIKWQDDLVFMVAGKMFACVCVQGKETGKLSFKVEDERFLELTERAAQRRSEGAGSETAVAAQQPNDRPGFRPAAYMARAHWLTLDDPSVVSLAEREALIRRAYELVFAKLSKKLQRELLG